MSGCEHTVHTLAVSVPFQDVDVQPVGADPVASGRMAREGTIASDAVWKITGIHEAVRRCSRLYLETKY